jgi:hypothetical protein
MHFLVVKMGGLELLEQILLWLEELVTGQLKHLL